MELQWRSHDYLKLNLKNRKTEKLGIYLKSVERHLRVWGTPDQMDFTYLGFLGYLMDINPKGSSFSDTTSSRTPLMKP